MKQIEMRVTIPKDTKLIGTRTDGDTVIIIYEPDNIQKIGFYQEPTDPIPQNNYPDERKYTPF